MITGKKFILIVSLIILSSIAFYFLYAVETHAPTGTIASNTNPKTATKSPAGLINPNIFSSIYFEKEGNIVKNSPGKKRGVWYFLYEEPGKSALTAELIFDQDSICFISGQKTNCSLDNAEMQGIRVALKGIKSENSTILVRSLTTIDKR